MVETQRFRATLEPRRGGGISVTIPFDPAQVWRPRDRYYVAGTIGGRSMRGAIEIVDGRALLRLGPAWCRDPEVAGGTAHEIVLTPEGPQLETIPLELAERLRADEPARRAFESLATFNRNDFVRPIADAVKPETRVRRADGVVAALHAGRREP
jgi:hypothetical protein